MKHTSTILKGDYTAPEMEVLSVNAEQGFSASMPGVTIKPWEEDNDSLEF